MELIVVIGEVLIDVFPQSRRLGGAPYNFACHLKAMGEDVRFFSRVGDDEGGAMILRDLDRRGFDGADVQVDSRAMTGEVFVFVDGGGAPEFWIQSNVAYDRLEESDRLNQALSEGPDLLYTGSVMQRSRGVFELIGRAIDACPAETCRYFDVNLRPGTWNARDILTTVEKADVVKLNEAEYEVLSRIRGDTDLGLVLIERQGLDAVCITRGAGGATLHTRRGTWNKPSVAPKRMADSVGAGDAFAAMLALGVLRGVEPADILTDAAVLAARICEIEGALPTDPSVYGPFQAAPKTQGRRDP